MFTGVADSYGIEPLEDLCPFTMPAHAQMGSPWIPKAAGNSCIGNWTESSVSMKYESLDP